MLEEELSNALSSLVESHVLTSKLKEEEHMSHTSYKQEEEVAQHNQTLLGL